MTTETRVEEWTASCSEAEAMARTITAQTKQTLRVVFFRNAIPRRCSIVDGLTYAEKYEGKPWAEVIFTTSL